MPMLSHCSIASAFPWSWCWYMKGINVVETVLNLIETNSWTWVKLSLKIGDKSPGGTWATWTRCCHLFCCIVPHSYRMHHAECVMQCHHRLGSTLCCCLRPWLRQWRFPAGMLIHTNAAATIWREKKLPRLTLSAACCNTQQLCNLYGFSVHWSQQYVLLPLLIKFLDIWVTYHHLSLYSFSFFVVKSLLPGSFITCFLSN